MKLLIYKSIVKSLLTHGAETWSIKRKHSYRNGLYKAFGKDNMNG
jgi:hypothetical protein